MKQVSIEWLGGMKFEAKPPSGHRVVLDAGLEVGGEDSAPTPMEMLAVALGVCTAMDVVSVMHKKRQAVTAYHLEVNYETRQGDFPHPITNAHIKHIVIGRGVDPDSVERAVKLSDEKYCSVAATLRPTVMITTEWQIEEAEN